MTDEKSIDSKKHKNQFAELERSRFRNRSKKRDEDKIAQELSVSWQTTGSDVHYINRTSDSDEMDDESSREPSFKADKYNIILLLFLYILQGIPLGLSAAIPMLLQNRGSSYVEQAQFSLTLWPFSLKLLWAPILDYLYIPKFGRRKSWLIPTQYLIGFFMMYLSSNVDDWLNNKEAPSVWLITFFFFILNFLAATQDIAVDGWALTMLKRRNVGYSSTCNSVGQTVGYFLGYVLFMALESTEFCNTYIRSVPSDKGVVTLPSYLFMWAIVFLITTTFVAVFKSEKGTKESERFGLDGESLLNTSVRSQTTPANVTDSYKILWSIMKLKPVFTLAIILLTAKIGFAACDGVTHLKLMEAGVPKEKMAIMAVPIVPLQILLPLVISKYTTGRRPMNVYSIAYPYRLVMNIVIALIVWVTPSFIGPNHSIPYYYYALLIAVYCIEQITVYSMFVATMAFFARISDPTVGGTYMTLLNTLSNLGSSWSTTSALWLVDKLTYKNCSVPNMFCSTPDDVKLCTAAGGKCETSLDGYYIETTICTIIGVLWYCWANKRIIYLQGLGETQWLRRHSSDSIYNEDR